jgi:hypothetical protein
MQESGRAGRDGQQASCICVFSARDACISHSLSQNRRISESALTGLLCDLFPFETVARLIESSAISAGVDNHEIITDRDICLPVTLLESTLSMTAATVETVATLLSLSPFDLITVCGSHLDTVSLRFRISLVELRLMCEQDLLVREIVRLATPHKNNNKQRRTEDVEKDRQREKASMSFFADDARAHALTVSLELQRGRQSDQLALDTKWEYLTDWICFSRASLARILSTTLDAVSLALFRLQRNGTCSYALSELMLRINITESALVVAHRDNLQLKANYVNWLLQTSERLSSQLDMATEQEGSSVIDMWKAAWSICLTERICLDQSETDDRAHQRPGAVQRFLSRHVLGDDLLSRSLSGIDLELEELFSSAPLPFDFMGLPKNSRLSGSQLKEHTQKIQQLPAVVQQLAKEPSLVQFVQRISLYSLRRILTIAGKDGLTSSVRLKLSSQRTSLIALTVTRILHGLTDSSDLSSESVENSFGVYRNFRFEQLLTEVSQILKRSVTEMKVGAQK